MSDQTILVTGANGFLGSAAVHALRRAGIAVVATGRREPADRVCDIGDLAALVGLLDEVRPTAVVHCAVVPDFGPDALRGMYAVNVLAPGVIAEWAARHDAQLVHASGSIVHGGTTTEVGPSTPIAPDSDYGRAKVLAEELVAASGCDAAVLRFCGIYGAGGPAHLGLNRAIDGAVAGTPPTIAGSGRARRNYIHVDDAATLLVDAVQQRRVGTFLAAGPEILSIAEMLQTVCDVLLPGTDPTRVDGGEAADQIVVHDERLPTGRSMREALQS